MLCSNCLGLDSHFKLGVEYLEENDIFPGYKVVMGTWLNKKTIVYFSCKIVSTVNPQFKPRGLIDSMVHNHPGSNRDYKSIESINLDV